MAFWGRKPLQMALFGSECFENGTFWGKALRKWHFLGGKRCQDAAVGGRASKWRFWGEAV